MVGVMADDKPRTVPHVTLTIRLSKEERARLRPCAAAEHLPLSTWLRVLGLREADKREAQP